MSSSLYLCVTLFFFQQYPIDTYDPLMGLVKAMVALGSKPSYVGTGSELGTLFIMLLTCSYSVFTVLPLIVLHITGQYMIWSGELKDARLASYRLTVTSQGLHSGGDPTEATAKPKRSFYAARDLYKYRHQYPNFKDIRYQNDLSNLRFYKNKIPFKPDGVYIEEVLNKWKGDYEKLEHNHTYIQWLFPLREQGLNFYAKELTTYEIEEFKKTKEAIRRFLLAYKMMLEFFGIKLIDKTGNVARAVNWQERFQHLNESQHNYLRITRILKSLGELGYESFKSPLVKFILHEALVENTIPNIRQSALEYFVYTIRDRRERRKLLRFAQKHYTPSENFIWGPPRKEQPERSKAQKTPTLPTSGSNSQTSMHKKSKDSKNSSVAIHLNSKTVEEKKGASRETGEETDKPSPEPCSEDTKPRNTEKDSAADESNSPPEEKTVTETTGKGVCPTSENIREGETQSKDLENPENTSCHDEVMSQ
ncbi:opioid growth factor receptor-like protein 1 isoform X1 [Cricetulus griseus]|nr:opioid growth factor receptor-like protein 1 isoform X1 [Cricetulus griseus]